MELVSGCPRCSRRGRVASVEDALRGVVFDVVGVAWWSGGPALGCFRGLNGEGLQFGDEVAQPAGVVELGLVALELVVVEAAGDGFAVDLSGP